MASVPKIIRLPEQFVLLVAVIAACLPAQARDKAAEKEWKQNYQEAEDSFKRSLFVAAGQFYEQAAAAAESFPAKDPRLAEALRKQAAARIQTHEFADAEAAARRALTLDEKRLGSHDWHLTDDLIVLGQACMHQRNCDEADKFFARAQDLLEWKFGRWDRTVAVCLQDRGDTAMLCKRYDDAEKYLKDALRLAQSPRLSQTGPAYNTPHLQAARQGQIAMVLNDLGLLYRNMKRYDESEKALTRAIGILETKSGRDSLFLCTPLANYADTLVAEHKYSEAETQLNRCLAILKYAQTDHPMTKAVIDRLAKVQKLEREAAPNLLDAGGQTK
jgi:tetratricopeptide (TPR) repeat protein